MEIKGFVGVSLIDWDGKVASVMFLPGCNLRCPFCHNTRLVLQPAQLSTIPAEKIWKYLTENKDWVDGVVITGGEPTVHEDLPALCQEIKKLGFSVKLDTNGTNPMMTRELIEKALVDYVAMDVKAPFNEEKYSQATGINSALLLQNIEQTAQTLLEGKVDYEFRTTLVPTLHKISDVEEICEKIKGCKKYVLQNFRVGVETINPDFKNLNAFLNEEVDSFFRAARKFVPHTTLRK